MFEEGAVLGLPFCEKANGMARMPSRSTTSNTAASKQMPQRSTAQIELRPGTGVIVVTPFKVQVTL